MLLTDVSAVLAIAGAAEAVDGVAPLDEAWLLALRNRPESISAEVRPDGFALLLGTEVAVVVRPTARGRGLGGSVTAALLHDLAPGRLTAWMHGDSPAARALAARFGFVAERELWVMRRRSAGVNGSGTPGLPDHSPGVEIRGFRAGDEEQIVRVNAAAFSWHPEQGSMDLANLKERMSEPWFEPEGLIEAWEGETLLGFHWTKRHNDRLGEVYVVAVDPAAQGRGLGRLLTVAGLEHMRELDEVHLYVESDNVAAARLYESLGFTHSPVDTHVQFVRP
ncbi:mycothiol synthase [Nocardioides sp. Kera G14]|uniref:mycothiol synthase n=1 Tax=Nocardioides sp. Kera G14 TaxID=2884264 RepID=UPI001D0FCCC2|nr:mycothiol synthase [Nocardioides sp. Kera G14]UDY23131.1 mycothiol synthase [Nocardioides sp. Kera G14]